MLWFNQPPAPPLPFVGVWRAGKPEKNSAGAATLATKSILPRCASMIDLAM
jgi:hypothetical protein